MSEDLQGDLVPWYSMSSGISESFAGRALKDLATFRRRTSPPPAKGQGLVEKRRMHSAIGIVRRLRLSLTHWEATRARGSPFDAGIAFDPVRG